MSEFISFDIPLAGILRFKLTNKAVSTARDLGCNSSWFLKCSKAERVLVSKDEKNDMYVFHFFGNVLRCTIKAEDNNPSNEYFLVVSVSEENYINKNIALHSGRCFYLKNGILISYYNSSNGFHYFRGKSILAGNADRNCSVTTWAVARELSNKNEPVANEPEYQPNAELMEYLHIAKEYSEAEYMLSEEKALTKGTLNYSSIAGCEYARIDNSAYRFFVDRIDEKNYPVNTQVEVMDINDEKLDATVLDFGLDEEEKYFIDLLFAKQVDLGKIQTIGTISLSFSEVNKEVQQRAIEKIIDGTADAKYMNDILGEAEPKGFYDVDLTELKKELKGYKHPPNDSQVDGIEKGIATKDVYLVMGPPGTGKTTVILEWIKYFVKEKKMRVLVSSQNNKAVDNVLERIIQEPGIDALRIGNESKVTDKIKPYLFQLKLGTLRDKIKNTTDSHAKYIDEYILYWQNVREVLGGLKEVYDEKQRLEQMLSDAIKSLDNEDRAIDEIYKKYNALIARVQKDVNSINASIDKQEGFSQNSLIKKILRWPVYFLRGLYIKYKVRQYDKNREYMDFLFKSHEDKCNEYIALYDRTLSEIYIPERESAEKIEGVIGDVSIDYDGKIDKWNIFDFTACREMDMTSYGFYRTLTTGMDSSLTRAEQMKTELGRWQEIAVDTSNYTLNDVLLDGVNLVGATCIGINSQRKFSDLKFDVSIIDEAGQIQIHNALVPMSVSNKLIMLGDHKQIPPIADQDLIDVLKEHDIPTDLLEKSLFEDLYNRLPDTNKSMLDTQYRMPSEIADIISEWFYNGNYKSFSEKSNLTSALPLLSDCPFVIIDTSSSGDRRYERNIPQGEQTMHDNPLEADIASEIVSLLDKKGYNLDNVGIIAGLKAQVDLIRKSLKAKGVPSELVNGLAATLDSYQGQERDIIIYSFGRSSEKEPLKNGVGFLTELRRLNVAMSRCKTTLVMIGDMKFLSERESEKDFEGNVIIDKDKTEKNFSEFIRHILSHVQNGAGEIIDENEFRSRMAKWKNQG